MWDGIRLLFYTIGLGQCRVARLKYSIKLARKSILQFVKKPTASWRTTVAAIKAIAANLETGLLTRTQALCTTWNCTFVHEVVAQLGHLKCLDTWSVQVHRNGNACWTPEVHKTIIMGKCTGDAQACSLPIHKTWQPIPLCSRTAQVLHGLSWECAC